jgi:hypothetical protein
MLGFFAKLTSYQLTRERKMKKILIGILLGILTVASVTADVRERRFVSKGMSEAEVLLKIGKPDHESVIEVGGIHGSNVVKKAPIFLKE